MSANRIPVQIQNTQMNFLMLSEVVRMIETEDGLDSLLTMGCDAELLDQLRNRSTRDLWNISNRASGFTVLLSPKELLNHINGIDRQRRDDELCEYL